MRRWQTVITAGRGATGDSYTASLAIVDEADLVSDLDRFMWAVKPTITQLASVEGSSPRAPDGEPEDRADSYALACGARTYGRR